MLLYHILFKFAANKFNCLTKTHLSYDKILHENLTSVSSVSFRGGYAQGAEDVTSTYLTDAVISSESNWGGGNSSGGNHSRNSDYGYWESWHNTFNLTQTVSNLPAGYYRVSIQAFSDAVPTTSAVLTVTTSGEATSTAYINNPNGTNATFANIANGFSTDANLGRIYATVKVNDSETLTITFGQTASDRWIVYGNFKLEKLTDDEATNELALEQALASNKDWTPTNAGNAYLWGIERYSTSAYTAETGKVLYTTLTNMPAGKYNVELYADANMAWIGAATGDNIAQIFANATTQDISVVGQTAMTSVTKYTLSNVSSTDGTLQVGIQNIGTGGNWYIFRLGNITYLGADLDEAKAGLAAAVSNAEALKGTIPTAAYAALETVVNNNNKDYTTTDDYTTAIGNINTAIATYSALQSGYADYNTLKSNIQTLENGNNYTDNSNAKSTLETAITTQDEALEAATTSEGITTATTGLRTAVLTFAGSVTPSTSDPLNLTFLITNPGFDTDATGWTFTTGGAPGVSSSDGEYFEKDFDINQTLTGLPAGNYELKVQAFQRTGANADAYSEYTGGTNNVNAVIYLNDGSTTIKHWASDPSTTELYNNGGWQTDYHNEADNVYLPNSQAGSRQYFDAGKYDNSVLMNVSDGTLKFGFRGTETGKTAYWTNFDNFRLYYYGNAAAVTLSEDADFSALSDVENATVTLTRTFNANAWNTLVLPFDLSADEVTTVFGSDAKVASYTGTTEDESDGSYTLNFESATTISANVPVLIYGATSVSAKEITGRTVKTGTPTSTPNDAAFAFTGSYSKSATVPAGDFFISSDNKFYKAKGGETMKGMRAVFHAVTTNASGAKSLKLNIGGTTTGINGVAAQSVDNGAVYNVAGQRVSNSYKGLVIKNGKKYLRK